MPSKFRNQKTSIVFSCYPQILCLFYFYFFNNGIVFMEPSLYYATQKPFCLNFSSNQHSIKPKASHTMPWSKIAHINWHIYLNQESFTVSVIQQDLTEALPMRSRMASWTESSPTEVIMSVEPPTALSEALIESIAMFRFSKTPVTLLSASIQLSASTFNVNLLMMFPPFHSLPLLKAASLLQ